MHCMAMYDVAKNPLPPNLTSFSSFFLERDTEPMFSLPFFSLVLSSSSCVPCRWKWPSLITFNGGSERVNERHLAEGGKRGPFRRKGLFLPFFPSFDQGSTPKRRHHIQKLHSGKKGRGKDHARYIYDSDRLARRIHHQRLFCD